MGVIASPETPGDVFVHFSDIDADGYRELTEDESVEFRYEDHGQDGCAYSATVVRRLAESPPR